MQKEKEPLSRIFREKLGDNGLFVDGKGTFKYGSVVTTQDEKRRVLRLIKAGCREIAEDLGRDELLDVINNDTERLFKIIVNSVRKVDCDSLQNN